MRRSLRLYDNAVIEKAYKSGLKIQPVFIFDTDILKRFSNKQDRRISFLADIVFKLDSQLKKFDSRLLVFHGSAKKLVPQIAKDLQAKEVFTEEDFEPAALARDNFVEKELSENGIKLSRILDHLIIHPERTLKPDGKPYIVYTPFSKTWKNNLKKEDYAERNPAKKEVFLNLQQKNSISLSSPEAVTEQLGYRYNPAKNFPVDKVEKRFKNFIREKISGYKEGRNFMHGDTTSRISPYLRFGLISIRECFRESYGLPSNGAETWVNELIWREFYAMIINYFPETADTEFQNKYRTLKWINDEKSFSLWQEGKTGYPVVDAAMRELKETGWMHNRARMIVASFLTKNLLIDWRRGEEHFAQHLMDYEQASNVGGWQWAASTGTDAAPYFRMFNPVTQSIKFDPEGNYIRKYVPELKHLSKNEIHEPWKNPLLASEYPKQIVDYDFSRKRVMDFFKSA